MARRMNTADRARRLIAIAGYLTREGSVGLAEMAEQLGTTPDDLANDLETFSYCGVEPYSPYDMCEVSVQDGRVTLFGELPALKGPVRLSTSEAQALAAALQTAGFTADHPLTAKLLHASAHSFDAADLEHTIRAAISSHEHSVFETLTSATLRHEVVAIEYAGTGSDEFSTRDVEPTSLFAERGAWYLRAYCLTADAWRTFRVDRIGAATASDRVFAPRADAPGGSSAIDTDSLPVATVRFAPGEPFSAREWPGAKMTGQEASRAIVVEVPYTGSSWLARRIVARLGRVEVLSPQPLRDEVRELARRMLAEDV